MEETQQSIKRFVKRPARLTAQQEYIIETSYVRDKGLPAWAKQFHGTDCMVCQCDNRFNKPNGTPYIEVHHIIPLCEKGTDEKHNLSVLCAHHHRMAHFAGATDKKDLRNFLLSSVERRFKEAGL